MTDEAATKRVLKWLVPVDDHPHLIGEGKVVLVDCQVSPDIVTIWTEESMRSSARESQREVQVYGTGHPVPLFAEHVGSTMTAQGALVWHVYELPRVPEPVVALATDSTREDIWP